LEFRGDLNKAQVKSLPEKVPSFLSGSRKMSTHGLKQILHCTRACLLSTQTVLLGPSWAPRHWIL